VPSAEEATENQYEKTLLGALVCVHVLPEFVEVKIPPPLTTTANLVPSAEEATEYQYSSGTLLDVQVIPESVEV